MKLKFLFCFILLLFNASCGFEFVYHDNISSNELGQKKEEIYQDNKFNQILGLENQNVSFYQQELSAIRVQKKPDKIGFTLKQNLYNLFNPDNIKVKPKYFLSLNIDKLIASTFTTQTGASGRNKIILNISYQLKSLTDLKVIATNSITVSDNYNITQNRYANFVSDDEATVNLTKMAAMNIRNSLINDLVQFNKNAKH